MKAPKIKLPKLKMPDKKITIKNRFLQKNLLSLIVVAVLAIGTGTAYGTLSSRDADRGSDPVNGVNQDRYQVLVSGKGYKLSKKQEKDYKLQKKQNQVNAANAAQNDPTVIRSSSGSRVFRSGSYNYRYRNYGSSYKPSQNPRITTDINNQISYLDKKAGETLRFKVTATAYPYGTKNTIPSENIKIDVKTDKGSGNEAKVKKEEKSSIIYELKLVEGTNKITITATDKKTKKTSKVGPYKIEVGPGDSSSNPTDPTQGTENPPEPEKIRVTVNYGLGDYTSDEVAIDDSTKAIDILSKTPGVKVENGEIKYIEFDDSSFDINEFKSTFDTELNKAYNKARENGEQAEFDVWFSDKVDQKIRVDGKIRLGKGYPFDSTKWEASPDGGKELANGITLSLVLYED